MSGLTGARELKAVLDAMPGEIRKGVLRRATLAGAEVVRQAAEDRAPVRIGGPAIRIGKKGRASGGRFREPGFLADHMKKQVDRAESSNDRIVTKVGPSKDAFYGMFLEFGRQAHGVRDKVRRGGRGKKGAARGLFWTRAVGQMRAVPAMSARPFLGPAFESVQQRALDRMGEALGKGIDAAAKKLAGRYARSGLTRGGISRLFR
jgi:HK97 gp10 family phage protein